MIELHLGGCKQNNQNRRFIMNLTQNDRLKQVTFDTLIVGVDVGSKNTLLQSFDWRGFEISHRVFKFSNTGMGFLYFP